MGYSLGARSLTRLEGVDKRLVETVKLAITLTECDFAVTSGVRTADEQNKLFLKKASTKDGYKKLSMHQHGLAVDLVPWIDGQARWEVVPCELIAEAMREAAKTTGIKLRWGGTWTIISGTDEPMEDLVEKHPTKFFDGPHYEIRE